MTTLTRMFAGPRPSTPHAQRKTNLLTRLLTWHAVWAERRKLAALDDARLKDIGLTREAADREARRKTWDAPNRWLL